MTRNLRSLYSRVKRSFQPRHIPASPREETASLRRRNAALVRENMELAGYIRFLTGKCITFECASLVRQVEKGEVIS